MKHILPVYPISTYSLIALGIFLSLFVGMLFWVFQKGNTPRYQHAEQLPLDEANHE